VCPAGRLKTEAKEYRFHPKTRARGRRRKSQDRGSVRQQRQSGVIDRSGKLHRTGAEAPHILQCLLQFYAGIRTNLLEMDFPVTAMVNLIVVFDSLAVGAAGSHADAATPRLS